MEDANDEEEEVDEESECEEDEEDPGPRRTSRKNSTVSPL